MKRKWLSNIKQLLSETDIDWHPSHKKRINSALDSINGIVLDTSKKTLLIFDLNGILINKKWDKEERKSLLWKRPDIESFLEFIFKQYDVAVWSSARKHNVEYQAKYALGDYYKQLVFVMDQSHCVKEDDVFLKNLTVVWDQYPQYNESNTLIIDDSDEKMINNPKECHFNPGTWNHEETMEKDNLYNKFKLE